MRNVSVRSSENVEEKTREGQADFGKPMSARQIFEAAARCNRWYGNGFTVRNRTSMSRFFWSGFLAGLTTVLWILVWPVPMWRREVWRVRMWYLNEFPYLTQPVPSGSNASVDSTKQE